MLKLLIQSMRIQITKSKYNINKYKIRSCERRSTRIDKLFAIQENVYKISFKKCIKPDEGFG